jgi:hypothetical protein
MMPKAQDFFKAQRLTPEQAQAVVEFGQEWMKDQINAHVQRVQEWDRNARRDPYFVDGGGFDRNLATVRQAVRDFGDDELREVFDFTGVGSHPALLRFIKKMSRGLGEAKAPTSATGNPGSNLSIADTLYPTMGKQGS